MTLNDILMVTDHDVTIKLYEVTIHITWAL